MAKTKAPTVTLKLFDPVERERIQRETTELEKAVKGLKIETSEDSIAATKTLAQIQKLRRTSDAAYKIVKAPFNQNKKAIDAAHNADVGALLALEELVEKMIIAFRKADDARRAAALSAEIKRREDAAVADQKQRAEELRQAAAEAPTKAVAKLLTQQAAILESAKPIIDPVDDTIEEVQTLADGAHSRKTYHGAVKDFERLVLQVAAQIMIERGAPPTIAGWLAQFNPNPQASIECLTPKMPTINALANRLQKDLALEGVALEDDESIITR